MKKLNHIQRLQRPSFCFQILLSQPVQAMSLLSFFIGDRPIFSNYLAIKKDSYYCAYHFILKSLIRAMDMRLFLSILIVLFSAQLSAAIYSWKDDNGVTHFSETKPIEHVNKIKTISVDKDPSSDIVAEKRAEKTQPKTVIDDDKLSVAFLTDRWVGYSKSTKKQQEWIFKEDGFFSIKQTFDETSDIMYTGQWELDYEDIMLSIAFKAETKNAQKSSGFVSIQNSAEIYEHQKNRILVNFNEEEFWLERH